MAGIHVIHGSPVGALKHDLREYKTYRNEDIDLEKSHLNQVIYPADGITSGQCMDRYDAILAGVYHRGGKTINSVEFSIQRPRDLPEGKDMEFYNSEREFLIQTVCGGDESRNLLCVVHRDERGQDHMHFIAVFPETENQKFVTLEKKLEDGIAAAEEKLGIRISNSRQSIRDALMEYERRNDSAREKDAINAIKGALGLTRDEARLVYTRCRRLDSEMCEKRIMSKQEVMPKKFFDELHPRMQRWMDEHGPSCTVYHGGMGMAISADELKALTKETGITLETLEQVQAATKCVLVKESRIQDYERRIEQLEAREKERESKREWGQFRDRESVWGRGDNAWTR